MTGAMLKAMIILPGTVLVLVPGGLLLASRGTRFAADVQQPGEVTFLLAAVLFAVGGLLAGSTVRLFATRGKGTLAPWAPPAALVVAGPYRYIRNPMITGVVLMLTGEAVFFNAWPLLAWALIFLVGNMIYFPLFEEPSLVRRFGGSYQRYMARVPRWIPRLERWEAPPAADDAPPGPRHDRHHG
jgi:protein-S-isoprenylcysteine O-methyltransferase Ste14